MKDKAIEGIKNARQKDRLANDAAVADRNKKGVGKRTNIPGKSSGLSQVKSPSSSINQLNKTNLLNNISKTTNSEQDSEAKKRLQKRQQMQNQAIKIAEKIPVASKYAKMAKMAQKLQATKANRNPLKNMFGGNSDKEPTPAEAEEAMGAEQRGEEYKPEQAEGKFTAINSKTTKLIIVFSILGFMGANIFLCVILASAITDSAGKSYLETKENPTEDELAERYSANEEDSDNNSEGENNSNSENHNNYSTNNSYKISGVPIINQYNEGLPTGCETCSATMILNFYGYNITSTNFATNYLITKSYSNGSGPDPNSAFAGSPFKTENSFGIYAPAMTKSINRYLANKSKKAKNITGESLTYIIDNYVSKGIPVMVWGTIKMQKATNGATWTVNYTDENSSVNKGSTFTWKRPEHCLVLIGYDDNYYYFNDPDTGKEEKYSKTDVESSYNSLGKQAIVIE